MAEIKRIESGKRMSQAAVYGGLVWLAGQCGTAGKSVAEQTREALANVEKLLTDAGSDKTRILSTTIWLANIEDYGAMNAVWDEWIPDGFAPARSCSESHLGGVGYDVEIICIAAVN